jgi:hypothetical protein
VGAGIVWPGIVLVEKIGRVPTMWIEEEGALAGILCAQTLRLETERHLLKHHLHASHPSQTLSVPPAKATR